LTVPPNLELPVVREGRAIVSRAELNSLSIRLSGGVAVMLRADAGVDPALLREPKDIDLVTDKRGGHQTAELLASLGYEPDAEFNAINGHRRLMFFGSETGTQVDVFVGAFQMCHTIPISARLTLHRLTLPLAELLLMKLQIVELNEKDQRDILNLMTCHPIADDDEGAINGSYIASLCGHDWGLWRTCNLNLDKAATALASNSYRLENPDVASQRIRDLTERLATVEKSRRWRLRDRVGDRVKWYEDVEEVR
jgi:hypothetical protein